MSTPSPRRPRVSRDEARARIGAAAERLLARRRYAEITVDELMTEAGLARTAFYRHFTDLSQVVLELLEQLGADVLEPPGGDLSEPAVLRAALSRTVDFHAEHARLIVALDDAGRTDPGVAAAHTDFAERTARRLATLLPGTGPGRDELARALVRLNTAYLLDAFLRDPPVPRPDALAVLLRIWSGTLATGEPPG